MRRTVDTRLGPALGHFLLDPHSVLKILNYLSLFQKYKILHEDLDFWLLFKNQSVWQPSLLSDWAISGHTSTLRGAALLASIAQGASTSLNINPVAHLPSI